MLYLFVYLLGHKDKIGTFGHNIKDSMKQNQNRQAKPLI